MDRIQDMPVMNTDTPYHLNKSLENYIQISDKENKYLEAGLWQRHHFYPFFVSVDGLIGVEAEATLKPTSSRITTKWKHPYYGT